MTPYLHAMEILHKASSPLGFVASITPVSNYTRVWTRDSVVTGMAALLSEEAELIETFRISLTTVFQQQHPSGFMPSNVSEQGVSYGGTVGRADNPSWAVLGLCLYTRMTGDGSLQQYFAPQVEKCLQVLDAWEYNGKHLVYVPQSGDWADEYIGHGYLLFDQLLRLWALQEAAALYQRPEWQHKAYQIREVVEQNYWKREQEQWFAENLRHLMQQGKPGYWQMGFNPSRVYPYFDQLANALSLILDLGTEEQRSEVTRYHQQMLAGNSGMLPCFSPAIILEDGDMRDLSHNYAYRFRNYPGQFHNGGLWPVWNGFTVAALQSVGQEYAALHLQYRLEQACAAGGYNFNECLDAASGMPVGVPFCTWSAAGLIIGQKALEGKTLW